MIEVFTKLKKMLIYKDKNHYFLGVGYEN